MGCVCGQPEGIEGPKPVQPVPKRVHPQPKVEQREEISISLIDNPKHQEEPDPDIAQETLIEQIEPVKEKPLTNLQLLIQKGRDIERQRLTENESNLMPQLLEAIRNGTGDFYFKNAAQQLDVDLQRLLFFEDESNQTLLSVMLIESQYDLFLEMVKLIDYNDKDKRKLHSIGSILIKKIISFLRRPDEIPKALQIMEILSEMPIIESLLQIVKSESISTHINIQNPKHVKLLGRLHKLFFRFKIDTLEEFYNQAKSNQYFSIPKYPKTPVWNKLYLPQIKFNIFHQFAIKQKWDLFLNHIDEHYFEVSSDGYSPYMLMMRYAPFDVIEQFHQKYDIPDITYGRINIIHCFALNRNKCLNFEFLNRFKDELFQQPYDSLTPLALYLHRKDPQQQVVDYLKSKLNFQWDTIELNKQFNLKGQLRKEFKVQQFVPKTQFQLDETDHRYPGFKLSDQKWEQYSDYYLNNVQLAKILLRYNFHVKLDIDWQGYASNIDDHYNVHLIQLLLRANQLELASQEIKKIPLDQSASDQAFFQNILILLQCLKETNNHDIQSLLVHRILSVLKPEHLLYEVEGYYQFLRIPKETLYDCIVMVNNPILNEKLLSNSAKDRSNLIILNSKYHDNDNIFFKSMCLQYALRGSLSSSKFIEVVLGPEGPMSLYDLCALKELQLERYIKLFIETGEIFTEPLMIRKPNNLIEYFFKEDPQKILSKLTSRRLLNLLWNSKSNDQSLLQVISSEKSLFKGSLRLVIENEDDLLRAYDWQLIGLKIQLKILIKEAQQKKAQSLLKHPFIDVLLFEDQYNNDLEQYLSRIDTTSLPLQEWITKTLSHGTVQNAKTLLKISDIRYEYKYLVKHYVPQKHCWELSNKPKLEVDVDAFKKATQLMFELIPNTILEDFLVFQNAYRYFDFKDEDLYVENWYEKYVWSRFNAVADTLNDQQIIRVLKLLLKNFKKEGRDLKYMFYGIQKLTLQRLDVAKFTFEYLVNEQILPEDQDRIFLEIFPRDEEYALQNFSKVTLKSAQLSLLYQQYFRKGKFDILNHLLAHSYSKNVSFIHSIIISLSCADNDNMNYIRAARTSPALALNLEQFKSYIKLTTYNHADELLYNGFYDKLQLVTGKYSDTAARDLVYRQLAIQRIKNPFPASEIKTVHCFDLPPCKRERTLVKTKQVIPQAISQQDPDFKSNEKQRLKLQYQQNQQCAYQNKNDSAIFQSTGQKQDFLKCISIIKSDDQDVLLGQCLIFPKPIVLENFQGYFDLLFNHYLKANRKVDIYQYMGIFKANIEQLDLESLLYKVRTQIVAKFYVDLCILANFQKHHLPCDQILRFKLDEEKYSRYLNEHMTKYQIGLSEYTKKIISVLSKFTYTPDRKPNRHIKKFLNLDVKDLTFEQYCISQGRLDHVQKITFTPQNLQLALASLDIKTIIRFMDINHNETHLEFILKFLSENAALTYIQKYINLNSLNLTDSKGESLIKYVIHKKMRKVFDLFKSKQLDLVREHCQQYFHEAIQTGFYEIFELISPTAEDLNLIQQSKLIFPNEPIQPKAKVILELFSELRLYVSSTQKGPLFDEYIQLERACVGVIHALPTDFKFANKSLQEIFSQTVNFNYHPEKAKVQLYLMNYKVDFQSKALDIIKKARPLEQIPIEQLIENCYQATNANRHPIYDLALTLNPALLIKLADQSFIINNLYYGVQIVLNKQYNQLLVFNTQVNDTHSQINQFGLQVLKSIVNDNFKLEFQIEHLSTLSKVISLLETKAQGQITSNFKQFLKKAFPFEVVDTTVPKDQDPYRQSLLYLLHYYHLYTILLNFEDKQNLNSESREFGIANKKLKNKYRIRQSQEQIRVDKDIYIVSIVNDTIIGEEEYLQTIRKATFQSKTQPEFQQIYSEKITAYPQFDFSSILSEDYMKVLFEEGDKNFLFFEEYLAMREPLGVYQIDDVFAPHQHEGIRAPELHQQPSLMHTSSIGQMMQSQPQVRQMNNQQCLKEDFQFMFELLPDNTYQVRTRKKKTDEELVFPEFYHFQCPLINLKFQLVTQIIETQVLSQVIQYFYRYNEYLGALIEQKKSEDWNIDVGFYVKNHRFIIHPYMIPSYAVQDMCQKANKFIDQVHLHNESDTKISWKINLLSVLEVLVSKLVERNYSISSAIDQIFNWGTLIVLLHQILYNNLQKAQQVLKVIRGIYIEFNESESLPSRENPQGLDAIFAFAETKYLIYNHMLIIRLNVGTIAQQQLETQKYIQNVINKFDFYLQIFSGEQLVQYLFNKLKIDRAMLNVSNQLGKRLNKTITITVDHAGLARLYHSEIMQIKQAGQSRLDAIESIWITLTKLNDYFESDILQFLTKQLTNDRFDDMFLMRLSTILLSLRLKIPQSEIITSNTRTLEASGPVLTQLGALLKGNAPIQFMFGFQVYRTYFVSNCKLGDICSVCYTDKLENHQKVVQLVYSTPGVFIFKIIENDILTQQKIISNQSVYTAVTGSNTQYLRLMIDDIQGVIIYQATWPSDPLFNTSIMNLFFVDSRGVQYLCRESQFIKQMSFIVSIQDDQDRQHELDKLFGENQINCYSELSLTQLTPIFPDQINFEFCSMNQIKKQYSVLSGHNIIVQINGENFKVLPLEITQIGIACHFQQDSSNQVVVKKFQKQRPKEFKVIKFNFDYSLNSSPQYYLELISEQQHILDVFSDAYDIFKKDDSGPLLTNSLQFMTGYQSFYEIKQEFIRNNIKELHFNYLIKGDNQLIDFKDGILNINTLFDGHKIESPEEKNILDFFYDLVQGQQEPIPCEPTQRWQISDLHLLIPVLQKVLQQCNQEKSFEIVFTFDIQLSKSLNFYVIQEDRIQFRYQNWKDFSVHKFAIEVCFGSCEFGPLPTISIFGDTDEFIIRDCNLLKVCGPSPQLEAYHRQEKYQTYLQQESVYLVFGLSNKVPIHQQPISISFSDRKTLSLGQILALPFVHAKFISNSTLMITITSSKTMTVTITGSQISFIPSEIISAVNVQYITTNTQDMSKTAQVQCISNGVTNNIKNNVEEDHKIGSGNRKLIKLLAVGKAEDKDITIHKNYEGEATNTELLKSNTINMLSTLELQLSTRAGNERVDIIEFRDNLNNKLEQFNYENAIFVHSLYPQIQYRPTESKSDVLTLKWTPIFKGVYKLYIDDFRVKGKFVVLANSPLCTVDIQKDLFTIPFFEQVPFTFNLKDIYGNNYGDIEAQFFAEFKCSVIIPNSEQKIFTAFQQVNKFGQLNCNIHFEGDEKNQEEKTEMVFKINETIIRQHIIKIAGVSLDKRKQKFIEELKKSFRFSSHSLVIRRMNFLEDLLKLAPSKMNYQFHIRFQDEPGIDAGGLKREFYDMIGTTMKDDTYKFFAPVPQNLQKMFLNQAFNKIKEKQTYALLFGKLVANSIANEYVIGIDIVPCFWKIVYGEQVTFEDLESILDKQSFDNYSSLLNMAEIDLECLDMDFTIQQGNTTIDLIDKGSKTNVTKANLQIYLDKIADYLIYRKYEAIYKSFIEGFTSVVDINIFKKWLRPAEISLLTQGLLEIKPDTMLSKTSFSGGNNQTKAFWETYVMQADSGMLRNMLKFITGSSSFPFDSSAYIIQVQFQKGMDIRKLPLSHTCFKSIEVPWYTSYSQLKSKLDIAFTVGLEGFGFG